MGFLESAVVIYIREIYYPGGFDFPIVTMDKTLAITELLREAATMFMLLSAGIIAGRNTAERFAWFLYSFAVWDIFYYVFLYALIGWPESLLTWDILFLIPVMWTGPVITPVIISMLMILLAMVIIKFSTRGNRTVKIGKTVWSILISGAAVVFISFILDFTVFILQQLKAGNISEIADIGIGNEIMYSYLPQKFNWWIFSTGVLIIFSGIIKLMSNSYEKK